MGTENTEEKGLAKGFSREAKDKIRKEILSYLFNSPNALSTDRDTYILRAILVEDKTLKEVGDKFSLTPLRISQLFYRAVQRVNTRFETFIAQYENAIDLQAEVNLLRIKLQHYQSKENKIFSLSPEVREMLPQSVKSFNFSSRLLNILDAYNIDTLADLVKRRKREFAGYRNTGKHSVKEVDDFLTAHGLSWGMQLE
jgi:predicted DNA-binding protein YlxM (UPF0122 family)